MVVLLNLNLLFYKLNNLHELTHNVNWIFYINSFLLVWLFILTADVKSWKISNLLYILSMSNNRKYSKKLRSFRLVLSNKIWINNSLMIIVIVVYIYDLLNLWPWDWVIIQTVQKLQQWVSSKEWFGLNHITLIIDWLPREILQIIYGILKDPK